MLRVSEEWVDGVRAGKMGGSVKLGKASLVMIWRCGVKMVDSRGIF